MTMFTFLLQVKKLLINAIIPPLKSFRVGGETQAIVQSAKHFLGLNK